MCVRNQHGPVVLQDARAVRMCHAAHARTCAAHQIQSCSVHPGAVMPANVCHSIRHTPWGRHPALPGEPICRSTYVRHVQTTEHVSSLPFSVDICSASHATAYRSHANTGTIIQTPTHPTTRHTSRPKTQEVPPGVFATEDASSPCCS